MKRPKIGFIINPIAGGKRKDFLIERIVDEFNGLESIIETRVTEYPGHASEIAAEWVDENFYIIVAVGGDGTINEVAKELIDKNSVLGIIPYGSGNGFARHFGFPLKLEESIKVLKEGNIQNIDVGLVDHHPFFCTSGLGFDAETGYHFSHFGKRGFISYVFSFFRIFQTYKSAKYRIYINNDIIEREAFFINVANISQYGYNFKVAPEASAQDGTLDLVIVNKFPKYKGFGIAFQSFFGRIHKNPYVEYQKASEVIIEAYDENHHIHIDGEPNTGKKITHFNIKPVCLNVILPGKRAERTSEITQPFG